MLKLVCGILLLVAVTVNSLPAPAEAAKELVKNSEDVSLQTANDQEVLAVEDKDESLAGAESAWGYGGWGGRGYGGGWGGYGGGYGRGWGGYGGGWGGRGYGGGWGGYRGGYGYGGYGGWRGGYGGGYWG